MGGHLPPPQNQTEIPSLRQTERRQKRRLPLKCSRPNRLGKGTLLKGSGLYDAGRFWKGFGVSPETLMRRPLPPEDENDCALGI